MTRSGLPSATAICSLLLLGWTIAGCGEQSSQPPRFNNLVLIVVDTLRSDHLASYGYSRPTAPFLDSLAAEGIQLNGIAASSWTKPSVATLMTGLHPQRHRANTRADVLAADLPFLPEILQQRGFLALGYTANWFTGPSFGFDRGYDRFLEVTPPESTDGSKFINPASPEKPHASWATDSALNFAGDLAPPFFLSVHYLDPHDPYTPPAAWGAVPGAEQEFIQPSELHPWTATEEQVARLIDQYDAVIAEVDDEIRRLITGLEAAGHLRDTLVVITSDHGEEFLEHGGLTHGKTLFDEVLRVPLLLWAEGLPPSRSDVRFHHVDLLPTLLDALELDSPLGLDGVSHWGDVVDNTLQPAALALHHLDLDATGALALGMSPWKWIHSNRPLAGPGEANANNLLFHLGNDSGEQQPATDTLQHQDLLQQLVARHHELSAAAGASESRVFDEALRRDLAGLGYLDPTTPQAELERRNVGDRLRTHDARPWGLFAGTDPGTLPSTFTAEGGPLLQFIRRQERAIAGRDNTLHWALARPRSSRALRLTSRSPAARLFECELQLDAERHAIRWTERGNVQTIELPTTSRPPGILYVDLSCAPNGALLSSLSHLSLQVIHEEGSTTSESSRGSAQADQSK